jgi:hypothetical protein
MSTNALGLIVAMPVLLTQSAGIVPTSGNTHRSARPLRGAVFPGLPLSAPGQACYPHQFFQRREGDIEMQFKDLATQLAGQSTEPLEGTIVLRQGKKEGRQITTFVLRTVTRPPRTLYRKNLRTDSDVFLEAEVPARVLDNIKQKLHQP